MGSALLIALRNAPVNKPRPGWLYQAEEQWRATIHPAESAVEEISGAVKITSTRVSRANSVQLQYSGSVGLRVSTKNDKTPQDPDTPPHDLVPDHLPRDGEDHNGWINSLESG